MHRTEELTAANIEFGNALESFDNALDRAKTDVMDRPGIPSARVVTFKVKINPEMDKSMTINTPNIEWTVDVKVPGEAGMVTKGIVKDGKLLVNIDDELFAQTSLVGRDGTVHTDDGEQKQDPENLRRINQS